MSHPGQQYLGRARKVRMCWSPPPPPQHPSPRLSPILRTCSWAVRGLHSHQAANHKLPLRSSALLHSFLLLSRPGTTPPWCPKGGREDKRQGLGPGNKSGREGCVSGTMGSRGPQNELGGSCLPESPSALSLCLLVNASSHLTPSQGRKR